MTTVPGISAASLNLLLHREQITDYIRHLGWLLDNFRIGEFVEEFVDGGSYKLIPRENHESGHIVCIIDDSKARLRYRRRLIEKHWHFEKFRELRLLSPVSTAVDGDGAHTVTNFLIMRTNDDGVSIAHLAGVFEDDFVLCEGRWRIKSRLAILDTYLPHEAIVVPP